MTCDLVGRVVERRVTKRVAMRHFGMWLRQNESLANSRGNDTRGDARSVGSSQK
jgi:hypothetical protein